MDNCVHAYTCNYIHAPAFIELCVSAKSIACIYVIMKGTKVLTLIVRHTIIMIYGSAYLVTLGILLSAY